MPQRSKIETLPPEIKDKLNRLLIDRGFSGYDSMADEINAMLSQAGYEITVSRSGLHRYGQDFEDRLAAISLATEQARAVAEAAKDDENNMNEALIRLVQTKTFEALVQTDDQKSLPKMGLMIAKLSKASVDQKKYMNEVRDKARQTADEVVKEVKAGGLSEEKAAEIRRKILGIV